MAKGNNANSNLYKKLHEEYGLELDVDFYLHPQSGSYIIKHNAVKKIVAKQREKGFIIETPMGEDVKWHNDGTREGMHGKEVVCSGNFYLKNKDGEVIEKVYKLGEVNPKNCKNAYPQTMALKRMYDRGVLDLLRFAQEGLYSDVEADEFRQSRPKKPTKQTPPVAAAEALPAPPVARPAPPVSAIPKVSPPPSAAPPVANNASGDEVASVLEELSKVPSEDPRGFTINQIKAVAMQRGWDGDVTAGLKYLIDNNFVSKSGEKRGTRYKLTQTKSVIESRQEYDSLWSGVAEELRQKGIEYSDLMNVVNKVTGFDTVAQAFQNKSLTKEQVAEIRRLGILKVA